MGSTIKILDSDRIRSFGQSLCGIANSCSFLDPSVEQAYRQAEESLSQMAHLLRQQLQQAKDELAQTKNADDRKAMQSKMADLTQRVNQVEQLLHESKASQGVYEARVREMQTEFSSRADKVGSVLISFIEELEGTI